MDRSKILTHGKPALAKFLTKLQIYKSIADDKNGRDFFGRYCIITEEFKDYRNIVMKRKENRTQWVQPNTVLVNRDVQLKEYPATKEGIIQSWAERDV
jgi:dipeptidyl-peptidase III